MSNVNLGTGTGILTLNVQGLIAGVQQAISSLNQLQGTFQSNAQGFRAAAEGMAAAGDLIIGMFVGSINEAKNFESGMVGVERSLSGVGTNTADVSKQVAQLRGVIIDLNAQKITSLGDLTAVASVAARLGLRAADIKQFTSTVADLSAVTGEGARNIATNLSQVENILGTLNVDLPKFSSSLEAVAKTTQAPVTELLGVVRQLAGAGTSMGFTQDQLIGIAGALTAVGEKGERGGTAVIRAFDGIDKSVHGVGGHLDELAKVSGVSAEEFKRQWQTNASGAFLMFIQGLQRVRQAGGDVTGVLRDLGLDSVRLQRVVEDLAAGNDKLAASLQVANQGYQSGNELTKDAAARYGTLDSQVKLFHKQIQDAGVEMGSAFLPILKNIVATVTDMVRGWNSLDPSLKLIIGVFVLLAGVISVAGAALLFMIPRILAVKAALAALAVEAPIVRAALLSLQTAIPVVGLLLAGLSAIMIAVGHNSHTASGQVHELADANNSLATALRAAAVGQDQQLRSQISALIIQKGLKEEAARYGISVEELYQVLSRGESFEEFKQHVLGSAAAVARFDDVEKRTHSVQDRTAANLGELDSRYDKLAHTIYAYRQSILQAHGDISATDEVTKALGISTVQSADDASKATSAEQGYSKAIEDRAKAAQSAVSAADAATKAEDRLATAHHKVNEAQRAGAERALAITRAQIGLERSHLDAARAAEEQAKAEHTLGTARAEAARAVADAQSRLEDAQARQQENTQRVQEAYLKLQNLYEKASEKEVADATNAIADAQLNLLKSTRTIADAEFALQQIRQEGGSARDIQDAEMTLQEARNKQQDATEKVSDAQDKLNKLRAGPDPAAVLAAELAIQNAQRQTARDAQAIVDAEDALNKARDEQAADTKYKDAQLALEGAQLRTREAADQEKTAQLDLQKAQATDPAETLKAANDDLRDAIVGVAKAQVDLKEQTALARGETYSQVQKSHDLMTILQDMNSHISGPLHTTIQGYIDQLMATEGNYKTTVSLDTSAAEAALARWKIDLQGLSEGVPAPATPGRGTGQTRSAGGLITSPTLALVGEAGAELILPLTDMQRTMSLLAQSGLVASASSSSYGQSTMASQAASSVTQYGGDNIQVHALTNANAQDIANEITWSQRTRRRV